MKEEKIHYFKEITEGVQGLVAGYAGVFKYLFRRPITIQYPEEKRQLPARSRARIILTRDPQGRERCVACYLCSGVCPVSCISMQSTEDENGRRYAAWFRINFARCIYCGFCEEACPTLAIQLTPNFEFAGPTPLGFVAEKEDLLVDHGGKDKDYNFYQHAGVDTGTGKGTHLHEKKPVNYRSNLP